MRRQLRNRDHGHHDNPKHSEVTLSDPISRPADCQGVAYQVVVL
jgi:hypothetical protein